LKLTLIYLSNHGLAKAYALLKELINLDSSHTFVVSGGGQGSDNAGQTALGAELKTGVSRNGNTFTHPVGINQFSVSSEPSWYQWINRGEVTLNKSINSKMDELCKDDEDPSECED